MNVTLVKVTDRSKIGAAAEALAAALYVDWEESKHPRYPAGSETAYRDVPQTEWKKFEWSDFEFCPTGEGGGIDPTCSPKDNGAPRLRQTRISSGATKEERVVIEETLKKHDPRVLSRVTYVTVLDHDRFEAQYGGGWKQKFPNGLLGFFRMSSIFMDRDNIVKFAKTGATLDGTLNHEIGHALWQSTPAATRGVWQRKYNEEPRFGRFTRYATTSAEEAFSETYMAYVAAGGKAKQPDYKAAFDQVDNFLAHATGKAVGGKVVRNP